MLAYNRIHHYLPTAYLSDRSLANWRLAQMYKHFTAANEYFVESKASMEYEPDLVQALDAIFVGVTEVQRLVRDRAKLGSTEATSVSYFPHWEKAPKIRHFREVVRPAKKGC